MDATLERAVDRWRDASLLSDDQAQEIRAFEQARRPDDGVLDELTEGRSGLVAEGLAYLGAALALGAGIAVFGELWGELSAGGRVALAAGATAVLAIAAWVLRDDRGGSVRRLATVLAALSVVGVAVTIGVSLDELTRLDEGWIPTLAGFGALAVGVPVHLARESWPTTLAMGAALLAAVFGTEELLGIIDGAFPAAVTMMGIGLAWAAAGWAGLARPRSAFEITGLVTGGVGVQVLAFEDATVVALLIGLLVAGAALAIGLSEDRTSPAVLGGIGVTVFAPQLVLELFGDALGGPLALFVGGVTLVAVAVVVLRQKEVV